MPGHTVTPTPPWQNSGSNIITKRFWKSYFGTTGSTSISKKSKSKCVLSWGVVIGFGSDWAWSVCHLMTHIGMLCALMSWSHPPRTIPIFLSSILGEKGFDCFQTGGEGSFQGKQILWVLFQFLECCTSLLLLVVSRCEDNCLSYCWSLLNTFHPQPSATVMWVGHSPATVSESTFHTRQNTWEPSPAINTTLNTT